MASTAVAGTVRATVSNNSNDTAVKGFDSVALNGAVEAAVAQVVQALQRDSSAQSSSCARLAQAVDQVLACVKGGTRDCRQHALVKLWHSCRDSGALGRIVRKACLWQAQHCTLVLVSTLGAALQLCIEGGSSAAGTVAEHLHVLVEVLFCASGPAHACTASTGQVLAALVKLLHASEHTAAVAAPVPTPSALPPRRTLKPLRSASTGSLHSKRLPAPKASARSTAARFMQRLQPLVDALLVSTLSRPDLRWRLLGDDSAASPARAAVAGLAALFTRTRGGRGGTGGSGATTATTIVPVSRLHRSACCLLLGMTAVRYVRGTDLDGTVFQALLEAASDTALPIHLQCLAR